VEIENAAQVIPADERIYLISNATVDDVPEILALQLENQVTRGGFLSIEFPAQWFETVIKDMPIVVARRNGRLVGYLVSSPPASTQHLPLPKAKQRAYPGGRGAYNSGPLCIAQNERGRGLIAKLFKTQRSLLAGREGIAFIRRDNAASRAVHARYGFREVAQFSHAGVDYLVVSYFAETIGSHD
jgi:L-amino acid N-acyltransferase YncA